MSVSIQELEGVKSVKVSLNKGLVSIELKPGNTVTLSAVRQAIKNDAFTPKDAKVVAVGDLTADGRTLRFKILGTSEAFPVAARPDRRWHGETGHRLTAQGTISAASSSGGTFRIASVSKAPTARDH